MKHKIIITGPTQREYAMKVIKCLPNEPVHEVTVKEHKKLRSLDANSKLWAMLTEVSGSVVWHGQKLSKEEWKDIFTAALKRQKVVPGLDNGFVVLGAHTSKMSVAEFSEMIELITAFGTQQGVKFRVIE